MKKRIRVTVELVPETISKIEDKIRAEYPKLKTMSDVVRAALKEFL
ncbi:MAG: hypothetical protein QXZ30_02750 [Candidatus Bilamarchaeaceae archaeon]